MTEQNGNMKLIRDMAPSPAKTVLNRPNFGISPAGFPRIHVELAPSEVAKLIGYDPRSLVQKARKLTSSTARAPRSKKDMTPHNVSAQIVALQNQVQRSIDTARVATMVTYLKNAFERGAFADWEAISVVTMHKPDISEFEESFRIYMDSDAEYFIADGQHRYCAILDFIREYPEYAGRFTQAVTISILPPDKLIQWAGQAFHDRNYFAVAVRAGKALAVDYRDPLNALAKELAGHPTIVNGGGIAYERDTLLKGDSRLTTHSVFHRFVRGFLFGRPGLDKGYEGDFSEGDTDYLRQYLTELGEILPWEASIGADREEYLTRTSVVFAALSVIGHDLYFNGVPEEEIAEKIEILGNLDWRRSNVEGWVGILGSEKDGQVAPSSARPAIDATIRYLRDTLGIRKEPKKSEEA